MIMVKMTVMAKVMKMAMTMLTAIPMKPVRISAIIMRGKVKKTNMLIKMLRITVMTKGMKPSRPTDDNMHGNDNCYNKWSDLILTAKNKWVQEGVN